MEVLINGDPAIGPAGALMIVSYTEPTLTKKQQPITNLAHVIFYAKAEGLGQFEPMAYGVANPNGGGQISNQTSTLPIPLNWKGNVEVWAVAVNLDGQPSDETEHIIVPVSRVVLDPMDAPMPPS